MNISFNPAQPTSKQQLGFGTNIQIDVDKVKPDISEYELYQIKNLKKSAGNDHLDYVIKVKSPRDGMIVGQIIDPQGKTLYLKEGAVSSASEAMKMSPFGLDNLDSRVKNIYENALTIIREHLENFKCAEYIANSKAFLKK